MPARIHARTRQHVAGQHATQAAAPEPAVDEEERGHPFPLGQLADRAGDGADERGGGGREGVQGSRC
eukprot:scaffold81498_cov70-Phaeocystis_antarctica.AAC.1